MNEIIITLVLACTATLIVLISLNAFSQLITDSCDSDRENFVDKYYHWNWNDPTMITLINQIDNRSKCTDCTYSMSCDYTDDAQPFCYRSLDIPDYDSKNHVLRNNSI